VRRRRPRRVGVEVCRVERVVEREVMLVCSLLMMLLYFIIAQY
jgi:hypothetical protein